MTSSNTIAFGADTLDVDSVKVPGTMLVVRRALLAYEKKMQPGDHLVVCAEEVGKKGRNRVEVAVIHERADAVAAKAAIDRGDDVSAKIQRVAVPPKELVSMCAEIESAEVPQLEGEAEPAGELGTAAEDAPAPVVEAEPVVIELSPEEKRLNEVAAALGDAAHLAEYVVIALGKRCRSRAPAREPGQAHVTPAWYTGRSSDICCSSTTPFTRDWLDDQLQHDPTQPIPCLTEVSVRLPAA